MIATARERANKCIATVCPTIFVLIQVLLYSITILVEEKLKCEGNNVRFFFFLVLSNGLPENRGETILLKFLALPVTGRAVSVVESDSKG